MRVRDRVIEQDLRWLIAVFNYCKEPKVNGQRLLTENSVSSRHIFKVPVEKNVRRPVATSDRYEATRAVADQVTMGVTWNHRRTKVRAPLRELLDIVNGTGRRITAVCSLHVADIDLSTSNEAPFGIIRFRGETDKEGLDTYAQMSHRVLRAVESVLEARKGWAS